MTDNEIIKALEACKEKNHLVCNVCPLGRSGDCVERLARNALWLINRQKAEIERLKSEKEAIDDFINPLPFKTSFDFAKKVKSESIREFAEKLKNVALPITIGGKYEYEVVTKQAIDHFVKEMTEGEND